MMEEMLENARIIPAFEESHSRWSRTPFHQTGAGNKFTKNRPAYMSHLFLSLCKEIITHHNWFNNCSMSTRAIRRSLWHPVLKKRPFIM